jgi:hypothetical protein
VTLIARKSGMAYRAGRLLQFLGLLVLPIAMAGNIARPEAITLGRMLALAGVGVLCFYLGHQLQRSGR